MRTITAVSLLTMGLAASVMAADFKGFVMDQKCSGMPEMRGNAECAQKCFKAGSPAVLVTPEGTMYKIANQDKVSASVGKNVTLAGKLSGDTITVENVK